MNNETIEFFSTNNFCNSSATTNDSEELTEGVEEESINKVKNTKDKEVETQQAEDVVKAILAKEISSYNIDTIIPAKEVNTQQIPVATVSNLPLDLLVTLESSQSSIGYEIPMG